MIRKFKGKVISVAVGAVALAPAVHAADPTSLDGFQANAITYIGGGNTVAIAAGVLSLGWVAFKIVRKYASKA